MALAAPAPGVAQVLALPSGAAITAQEADPRARVDVATGPWRDGALETTTADGAMTRTAWQVAAPEVDTLDLIAGLRAQLEADGFETVYSCHTRACGGFDFRFALDVLPEPEMHVDLGDFGYLAARRDTGDGAEHAALLVSHAAGTGFVQLTHVTPATAAAMPQVLSTRGVAAREGDAGGLPGGAATDAAMEPLAIASALESGGAAPLDDLVFRSGEATLDSGTFASLEGLAAYLRASPDRRITLVGHSDAEGGLAVNIALSTRRAEAVRAALIADYGIAPERLSAEGVGFLAPRASNLTDEGRTSNRRVEAVLSAAN